MSSDMQSQIVKAVTNVMAEVHRLEKADNNAFARYKFTSVDDFKDHLRPLMAKHGLSEEMDEVETELLVLKNSKNEDRTVARYKFGIALEHISGEKTAASSITIFMDLTGPQTTGAARSYALKEWLKSRFMASSGDVLEDADDNEQVNYSSAPRAAKGAVGRAMYERMVGEIRAHTARDTLITWAKKHREEIDTLPKNWLGNLRADYEAHLATLPEPKKANDKSDDGQVAYEKLLKQLQICNSADMCDEWRSIYKKDIESLPEQWRLAIDADFEDRKASMA